ncbi:MAG TPA: divalent metal cation transporter [Candidatus Udaeobacter sp.]|jgi:NRAMP (natural resistance-associated macrophage protein)-like metal ion transporter
MTKTDASKKANPVRRFLALLGPGLITGAADDDPSGITTYSIVGAQMGTGMLWTAFITWPFMGAVQFTCARIGMVTGAGLGAALRTKLPRWLVFAGALGLLAANTINVGSDLSGMADAAEMLSGVNSRISVLIFGAGIAYATIRFRYHQIAMIMKWLAVVLFAYVITAFIAGPDWGSVLRNTFVPSWPQNHAAWQNLVAILGTTISPYLFFWQAAEEVEEEKAMGRRLVRQRRGATKQEIVDRKIDVGVGTFFSNFTMYFIILTTALVLHAHGNKDIESSKQAAEALRPLVGTLAYLLYTIGIIGVGFLAIPTLAGSAAYAFAETFSWKEGLDEPFRGAIPFYVVLIFSILLGVAMDFVKINPVKALFWTAVINGVLAPFLLVGILIVASDRKLMQDQPSSRLSLTAVGVITLIMFGAAAAMFVL